MKQFDFTGVPEELKETMLGAYNISLSILESVEKIEGEDALRLELMGVGKANARENIRTMETQIQQTIDLFQKK